jgi:hypothetical protein
LVDVVEASSFRLLRQFGGRGKEAALADCSHLRDQLMRGDSLPHGFGESLGDQVGGPAVIRDVIRTVASDRDGLAVDVDEGFGFFSGQLRQRRRGLVVAVERDPLAVLPLIPHVVEKLLVRVAPPAKAPPLLAQSFEFLWPGLVLVDGDAPLPVQSDQELTFVFEESD